MTSRKKRTPMTLDGVAEIPEVEGRDAVPDVDRSELEKFSRKAQVSARIPLVMVPPDGPAIRIFGIRLMPVEDEFLRRLAAREQRSKHEVTRALLMPAVDSALVESERAPGTLAPRRAAPGVQGPQISVKLTDAELEKTRKLSAMESRSQQQVVRSVFLPALENELGQEIPDISDE